MATNLGRWTGTLFRRAGLFALFCYLAFHVARGGVSIHQLVENREAVRAAEAELARAEAEHAHLAERVAMLRPETLDLDFLDERARVVLGWARPDEAVFLLDTRSPAP